MVKITTMFLSTKDLEEISYEDFSQDCHACFRHHLRHPWGRDYMTHYVIGEDKEARTITMNKVLRLGTRYLNPLMLSLAGSRSLPMFSVVHHHGRHSGRSYATPLSARPTADGFIIPLTFGKQAVWFRNVQAEGGCVIRWKGNDYSLIEPEVVDRAVAQSVFSPLERIAISVFKIEQFVQLRNTPTSIHLHAKQNAMQLIKYNEGA
jgi:deazaflavin-dependent oxidoreductase (nitroreductase family)